MHTKSMLRKLWLSKDNRSCKPSESNHDVNRFCPKDEDLPHTRLAHRKDEAIALVALLRACSKTRDLSRGTDLHEHILKKGLLQHCSDALITMYAKCGALGRAKELLDLHPSNNAATWTALMAGFTQRGRGQDALSCFEQMQHVGLSPDAVAFTCVVKACGSMGLLDKGEEIHDEISKQELLGNHIELGNALVDMYARCDALGKARRVLEDLPVRDVITWTALIAGYANQGEGEQALKCMDQMQREGLSPNEVTFISVLKACGSIGALDKGEKIHDEIAKQVQLKNHLALGTAVVDMYAKCGALKKAQQALEDLPVRDVICWTALIAGYAQQGEGEQSLICFEQMQREGISPNAVTFSCILKACGCMGVVDKGEKFHDEIAKQGLLRDHIMLGNALVDMYVKCGALAKAQHTLEELQVRNVVSWNTLIAGYSERGEGEQALACYGGLLRDGLPPSAVTFTCILKACGSIGAIDKGERIHEEISEQGLLANDIVLGNALVDMYARCGALTKARRALEVLPSRDAASWNALIAGYAQHSEGAEALKSFELMQREGLRPDAITFSSLLTACSSSNLVEEAQRLFVDMSIRYGIKPDLEHYTCMIELFGRSGHLDKAVAVIDKVPCSNLGVWSVLLGVCQKWGDTNVGRWAFEHAVQVDDNDGAIYVRMASIYAAAGMHKEAEDIKARRLKLQHGKAMHEMVNQSE